MNLINQGGHGFNYFDGTANVVDGNPLELELISFSKLAPHVITLTFTPGDMSEHDVSVWFVAQRMSVTITSSVSGISSEPAVATASTGFQWYRYDVQYQAASPVDSFSIVLNGVASLSSQSVLGINAAAISSPEPGSIALLATGLLMMLARRRF
jgi:hypothetical protein